MAKLRLRAAARADLAQIDTYSADQFGEDIADIYARGFREAFALLRQLPMAGSAKPDLGNGLRSFAYRKHRIFYLVEGDTVVVVRIVHHAMDAKRALKG